MSTTAHTNRDTDSDSDPGRDSSSGDSSNSEEIHFSNIELGQLHILADMTHHYLSWCATPGNNSEDWQYDLIRTDWSHLNEPHGSNTNGDSQDHTYDPDLDTYHDLNVNKLDFLESKHEIRDSVMALTSAIATELNTDDTGTDTGTNHATVPTMDDQHSHEPNTSTGQFEQQPLTAYAD